MKVFISWSGHRSKAVAEALSNWLGKVVQALEPWISTDIEKGARWSNEMADRLEQSKVGIICLTQENIAAPWILFEAGALSKTKGAKVCTFLLDLTAADVEPPLGQFQHTSREKSDVRLLLKTINTKVVDSGERTLSESDLDEVFERFWPDLSAQLERISKEDVGKKSKQRTEREILEEVLEIVRNQDRRLAIEIQPEPNTLGKLLASGAASAALGVRKPRLVDLLGALESERSKTVRLSDILRLSEEQEDKKE